MATEVLVNDGGAPARILPFTAGSAIKGVILNCAVSGTMDEGKLLDVHTAGILVTGTDSTIAASGTTVAVCLETGSGTDVRLVKCLMRN